LDGWDGWDGWDGEKRGLRERGERIEQKLQVLANLGNLAYDPINFGFFRQLRVLELFLDAITESNVEFVEFGAGGLCNCACGQCEDGEDRGCDASG